MELTSPMIASIVVVAVVVGLQLWKFIQNRKRIDLFSEIFAGQDYDLDKDESDMVIGIKGSGNEIFNDIKDSINGYLGGTQGTEIDFQLLKDTIDRHCDMIEDEINTQMPLPLYFGLAGTMTGAIIGLFALVFGGSILALMSGTVEANEIGAANNINDLLWGVAIAMIASAFGIFLTSWNTIHFKDKKLKEETEKNKFLAWMQSRVLSAVPSGVSLQMKALVRQLTTFNRNFKSNTESIDATLRKAKEVYQSQADVIEKYNSIDLKGMADGVSDIAAKLGSSTRSLENFTQYLDTVHAYYNQMQVFAEKLDKETDRIGILQDIQKFFQSHKGVIAEETSEAHKNIQQSIKAIQDSTEQQINETYVALTNQSQKLRDAVDENNEQFRILCQEMRNKFQEQMNTLPGIAQNLRKIEDIPNQLEDAISRIAPYAKTLITTSQRIADATEKNSIQHSDGVTSSTTIIEHAKIPASMKWTVIVGIILITLATIGNTAYTIWKGETTSIATVQTDDSAKLQTTSTQNQ